MEKSKLYKGAILLAVFAWLAFILMDYWYNHVVYYFAFRHFQYTNLVVIYGAISAGLCWGILRQKKKGKSLVNGLSILGIAVLFSVLGNATFLSALGISMGGDKYFVLAVYMIFVIAALFFVLLLPALVLGNWFNNRLGIGVAKGERAMLDIAVGLMLITLVLFLLAALTLLKIWVVLPFLLLISGVFWKAALAKTKKIWWTPVVLSKKLSLIGILSFLITLIFFSLNFSQILRPFPLGFDSLSLYSNLPNLIAQYEGLVAGYQPYNWSLLMSLGEVVFGKVEFMLAISFMGGALCLFALYFLGRRWLNVNYALLSVAIFYSLPTVNFQSYKDMKIDLGLLFVSLAILIAFVNWITPVVKSKSTVKIKEFPLNLLVLMGLLSGFALGIKFTFVFLMLGLLMGVWYVYNGRTGSITFFALAIFAVLLLRLDDMSGVRPYHLSADIVKWLALLIGLGLMGYSVFKRRADFIGSLKASVIIVAFAGLSFLPWPIKNIIEAPNIDANTILFGAKVGPRLSPSQLEAAWKEKHGNSLIGK